MDSRFDNLAAAARVAIPLGQKKCGGCKHWYKVGPAPNGKTIGQCRESLRCVMIPNGTLPEEFVQGDPAGAAERPITDLTVRQLLGVLLPRSEMAMYPHIPEDFPACSKHTTPIAEV